MLRLGHNHRRANLTIKRLSRVDEIDRRQRRIVDALLNALGSTTPSCTYCRPIAPHGTIPLPR